MPRPFASSSGSPVTKPIVAAAAALLASFAIGNRTALASPAPGTSAPHGKVTSVGSGTFELRESGKVIHVDTVSGSTYQLTTASRARLAKVGGYVAGVGTVSDGELHPTDLAFVPKPPSFIPAWDVTNTPAGTEYFGKILSLRAGVATISTGASRRKIDLTTAHDVTATSAVGFKAIKVGETVEVNGPEKSPNVYTGHQINIGVTPAVVGQFD